VSVTLAFDEGPGVGLGHRRRIEALEHELEARGHRCALVSLGATAMAAGRIVVIDSYRLRGDDRGRVQAGVVVAIDDLQRDLDVDIVVDPSPGADGGSHRRAGRVLAGAAFALVSVPAAAVPAATVIACIDPVRRVLVTTGAADEAGVGAQLAATIRSVAPDVEVRLVVGPWGSPAVPAGVVPVHAPAGLTDEMAAASIVVTAGGVALLESCALGRPTIAVPIADNQRQAVAGLVDASAIVAATPATVGDAIGRLIGDASARNALGESARVALDGKGPARVVDAIEELV
jgi:spore coat polysaccharide biosynthesis predicted glycosyltransferase SpsG